LSWKANKMSSRQPTLRSILIYALYVISFAIIQVTALRDVQILGERPDLTLVLAILTGYLFGIGDGLAVGLAAGFLRDMLAGRSLGLGMLLLMYAAILAQYLFRNFFRRKTWMGLLQVLFITVLYEVTLVMLSWFFPMMPELIPSLSESPAGPSADPGPAQCRCGSAHTDPAALSRSL
jgi:rod shape-determining protein MreD